MHVNWNSIVLHDIVYTEITKSNHQRKRSEFFNCMFSMNSHSNCKMVGGLKLGVHLFIHFVNVNDLVHNFLKNELWIKILNYIFYDNVPIEQSEHGELLVNIPSLVQFAIWRYLFHSNIFMVFYPFGVS